MYAGVQREPGGCSDGHLRPDASSVLDGVSRKNSGVIPGQPAVAEVGLEGITTTATTATFSGTPAAAEAAVRRAKDALAAIHGGRGHPVQSLHAVIRKFAAMPGPSVPTDAERAEAIAEAIAEAKRADQRAVNLKAEMDRIAASTGVLVIREAYQDMPTSSAWWTRARARPSRPRSSAAFQDLRPVRPRGPRGVGNR